MTLVNYNSQLFISQVDHQIRDIDFPDGNKILAKNYCRNPTNDSRGPWCYTVQPDLKTEECEIPLCNYGGITSFNA